MSLIVSGPVPLATCEGEGVGGDPADAVGGVERF
jgi:hypothetical protein